MSAAARPWVCDLTIDQALARTTQRVPHHDALVFPHLGIRYNYRQFYAEVDRAARALLALDITTGDHVAVWSTNLPQWVILQFATARIGAVLVTINPAYRPFELRYVLQQSDACALFLTDRFKSSDYVGMLAEACPEVLSCAKGELQSADFPRLRSVVGLKGPPSPGIIGWEDFLDRGREISPDTVQAIADRLSPADPINIQYTSGTTGFPKAATLSHANLLQNVFYAGACQGYTAADRICIPVPFYHCFGCVLGTLCAAVYGAAMIVPAESFDPAATLAAIERERATSLYGVPTMFIAQLHDPTLPSRDLRSLRTGIMAGSPCPIETMRAVVDRMGCREITIGYGQTEASPIITQTRFDDPIELRVETVGRPIPGVEVKVIDPLSGAELGDSTPGELCARGHVVMLGYYKNPQATAEAIDADGWLHTGDLAVRLPNGYYKITGRLKDMVIRGGENIYPREIEEFLFTHPAIEQASVVGLPDPKFGEELCAWIKLKQGYRGLVGRGPQDDHDHHCSASQNDEPSLVTARAIRDFCKERLAHFKVPRYIRFVDAFPQTVTGKIQKFKIREAMREELGLAEQVTA